MKLTRQQKIARKAVATRKARQEFEGRFGSDVARVVAGLIVLGDSALVVEFEAENNNAVSKGRVAAIKANLTRNTYAPFVLADGSGLCNFQNI